MKILKYLAIVAVLFTACNKDSEQVEVPEQVKKDFFSGYAQKGPFSNGSSVTISELKDDLSQTGKVYSTTISDNSGSFEQRGMEFVSNYVELKVDGYYFNEVSGGISSGQITLYALADIEDANSANVNVLTHLEKPRVDYLVKLGMSFSEAKQQAQREVLAIFGFSLSDTSSEDLDLTNSAMLLAISCILQGHLSIGDMMELMANMITDIKTDGILDNMALGSKLMNNAKFISTSEIRNNLKNKYAEMGMIVSIPDFESYIQSFVNSNLYPQTLFITYPATGEHGVNILSDDVTSIIINTNTVSYYSMKADVPKGMSLKIVLRDGRWGYIPALTYNWQVSRYEDNRQEFTVIESGKPCDLCLDASWCTNEFTVEYYENGATTPTKTKTIQVQIIE